MTARKRDVQEQDKAVNTGIYYSNKAVNRFPFLFCQGRKRRRVLMGE